MLLGESSVGKTSIVTRFTTGKFQRNNATIGAAFLNKNIRWVDEDNIYEVDLEIWDTAGQERYRSLAPIYYRNTDVALIVFDVTSSNTFQKARSWVDELRSYLDNEQGKEIQLYLIGNKCDLEHESIAKTAILDMCTFKEVSAKRDEGIQELFEEIARGIPTDKFILQSPSNQLDVTDNNCTVMLKKSFDDLSKNVGCNYC